MSRISVTEEYSCPHLDRIMSFLRQVESGEDKLDLSWIKQEIEAVRSINQGLRNVLSTQIDRCNILSVQNEEYRERLESDSVKLKNEYTHKLYEQYKRLTGTEPEGDISDLWIVQ